jgi:hypothetical protein
MLRSIFSFALLLFAFKDAAAQQLIYNGSFETTGIIRYRQSATWNQTLFANSWLPIGTPDIFTDNASANDYWFNENGANIPCYPEVYTTDNMFGQQNPRTHTMAADGNTWNHNYVFLHTSGEFIYQVLPNALEAGDCYELSYWINRADVSGKAYCAQAVVSSTNISTLPLPHTLPPDAIYLTTADQPSVGQQGYIVDKLNWTKITFRFKAQGGERYITIGDFDQYSEKIEAQGPTDCGASTSASCSSTCNAIIGNGESYHYFYDDVSLTPVTASSFPNPQSFSNTTISTNYTGANLLLTGNITISGNRTWSNCQVRCNASTKIVIPAGASLTINGTVIKTGCDMMWQGMIVEGNGRFISISSTVEDALTMLTVNGTGGWQITNSTFRKNERDIVINGTSQYVNFIKGSTFDHTVPLGNPAQGIGGYGIEGVVVNPQTSNTVIAIGGPNMADICQFSGGQYGVRSKDANVDITRCLITGAHQTAVDFQGLNPNGIKRTLNITSSSIVNSRRNVVSQHGTNLKAQGSSFSGSLEHSIEWSDNHDCNLLVGDLTDPTKGNSFQLNAWANVVAWDNKTTSAPTNFALATTPNVYTSIIIANNTVTAAPYSAGFLIGEWTLGSNVPYHDLQISKNKINGTVKAIQMYNIRGWAGAFSNNPPPNLPSTATTQNQISVAATLAPTAFGINAVNAPGFDHRYNLIGSDNPYNWQNTGIRLENSQFSQVYNNGIEAGTGISAGLDMQFSGLYCNILSNNVSGITLAYAGLCPNVLYPHGSQIKAYSNLFVADQPATVNIHNYASPIANNNWVWDFTVTANSPKVWYSLNPSIPNNITPNQSGFSMITSWTGAFDCPYDPTGMIVYPGGPNVHGTMSNADAQWRADYDYEMRRIATGDGDASIASNNIKSIIGIENNIGGGHYPDALTALNSLSPVNAIEQNYKTVLTVFANLNYPEKREPTETELATLTTVAEQFPRIAGASVTLARTFLAVKYNLYFKDETFAEGIAFGNASIASPCSLYPSSGTELGMMDEEGNDLEIKGTIISSDGNFAFDPYQLAYYSNLHPETLYRIYSKYGSTYTVVNSEFKTLADWMTQSPISLSLSGVSVALDTATSEEFEPIENYTSITDGEGNVYSVGTTTVNGTADFLIAKRNSSNILIWSRTYDGPASKDDSATCMTIEKDGIYVAGKVSNGKNFDFQALKYDFDGNLQWTSTVSDDFRADNTPTGISVADDGSVHVSGTTIDGRDNFRFIKYWQCLPSSQRVANANVQNESSKANTIEFYPNPTNGNITIALGGQSGGTLELFSLEGQLIFTKQITQSGEVVFPESQVANGIYLLKFSGSGQPQFSKLIIQHNQ